MAPTMRPHSTLFRAAWVLTAALAFSFSQSALADDHGRARRVLPLPEYQQECAACHLAYPPGMLSAASWQRVMNTLPRHYGTDASLDPALQAKLSAWLAANAGTHQRVSDAPPEDRITRSPWFVRKHREVPAATWKLPAVKSASHCAACHRGAEEDNYDEDLVRLPR